MRTENPLPINGHYSNYSAPPSELFSPKSQEDTPFHPQEHPIDQGLSAAIQRKQMSEEGFITAAAKLSPLPLSSEVKENFKALFCRPLQIQGLNQGKKSAASDKWLSGGIISLLKYLEEAIHQASLASLQRKADEEYHPFVLDAVCWQAVGSIVPCILGDKYYQESLKPLQLTLSPPKKGYPQDIDLRSILYFRNQASKDHFHHHFDAIINLFHQQLYRFFASPQVSSLKVDHLIQTGEGEHYTTSTLSCTIDLEEGPLHISIDLLLVEELKHQRMFSKHKFLQFQARDNAAESLALQYDSSASADLHPMQALLDQSSRLLSWPRTHHFNLYVPARYLNLISLNHTVWQKQLAEPLMLHFIEEADKKGVEGRAHLMSRILVKTSAKHLNSAAAKLAKAYNSLFYLQKTEKLSEDELAFIRCELAKAISAKEVQASAPLIQALFALLQTPDLSLKVQLSFLQLFALLNAQQGLSLIRRQDGQAALQLLLSPSSEPAKIAEEDELPTLLFTCELSSICQTLASFVENELSHSCLALLEPLYHCYLPKNQVEQSPFAPYLPHLSYDPSQMESLALKLLSQSQPMAIHLGYMLLMQLSLFGEKTPFTAKTLMPLPKAVLYPAGHFSAKALLDTLDSCYQNSSLQNSSSQSSLGVSFSFAAPLLKLLFPPSHLISQKKKAPSLEEAYLFLLAKSGESPLMSSALSYWRTQFSQDVQLGLKLWAIFKDGPLALSLFTSLQPKLSLEEKWQHWQHLLTRDERNQAFARQEALSCLLPLLEAEEFMKGSLAVKAKKMSYLAPFFKEARSFQQLAKLLLDQNKEDLFLSLVKLAIAQNLLTISSLSTCHPHVSANWPRYVLAISEYLLSHKQNLAAAVQLQQSCPQALPLELFKQLIEKIALLQEPALDELLLSSLAKSGHHYLSLIDNSLLSPLFACFLTAFLKQNKENLALRLLEMIEKASPLAAKQLLEEEIKKLPKSSKETFLKRAVPFYLTQMKERSLTAPVYWLPLLSLNKSGSFLLFKQIVEQFISLTQNRLQKFDPQFLPHWEKIFQAPQIPPQVLLKFLTEPHFFQQVFLQLPLASQQKNLLRVVSFWLDSISSIDELDQRERSLLLLWHSCKNLMKNLMACLLPSSPATSRTKNRQYLAHSFFEVKSRLIIDCLPLLKSAHLSQPLLDAANWLEEMLISKESPSIKQAYPHFLTLAHTFFIKERKEDGEIALHLTDKMKQLLERFKENKPFHPALLISVCNQASHPLFVQMNEQLILYTLENFSQLDPLLEPAYQTSFYPFIENLFAAPQISPEFNVQCLLHLAHPVNAKKMGEKFNSEKIFSWLQALFAKQFHKMQTVKESLNQTSLHETRLNETSLEEYRRLFSFINALKGPLQFDEAAKSASPVKLNLTALLDIKNKEAFKEKVWLYLLPRIARYILEGTSDLKPAAIKEMVALLLSQLSDQVIIQWIPALLHNCPALKRPTIALAGNSAVLFYSQLIAHFMDSSSPFITEQMSQICGSFFSMLHRVDNQKLFQIELDHLFHLLLQKKIMRPLDKNYLFLSILKEDFSSFKLAEPDTLYQATLEALDIYSKAAIDDSIVDGCLNLAISQLLLHFYAHFESPIAEKELAVPLHKLTSLIDMQAYFAFVKSEQCGPDQAIEDEANPAKPFEFLAHVIASIAQFFSQSDRGFLQEVIFAACSGLDNFAKGAAQYKKPQLLFKILEQQIYFLYQADHLGFLQKDAAPFFPVVEKILSFVSRTLYRGEEGLILLSQILPLLESLTPHFAKVGGNCQTAFEIAIAVIYCSSVQRLQQMNPYPYPLLQDALSLLKKTMKLGFFKGQTAKLLSYLKRLEPVILRAFKEEKKIGDQFMEQMSTLYNLLLAQAKAEDKQKCVDFITQLLYQIALTNMPEEITDGIEKLSL